MTREEEIKKQAEKKALEPSRLMHPYAKQHKVMSAYEIGFIEGAVWADAHPHWISVEDKLPPTSDEDDESDDYLIVDEDGDMNVGYYNKMDKTWFSCDGYILDATHWCYLPQLPVLSNSGKTGKDLEGGDNG